MPLGQGKTKNIYGSYRSLTQQFSSKLLWKPHWRLSSWAISPKTLWVGAWWWSSSAGLFRFWGVETLVFFGLFFCFFCFFCFSVFFGFSVSFNFTKHYMLHSIWYWDMLFCWNSTVVSRNREDDVLDCLLRHNSSKHVIDVSLLKSMNWEMITHGPKKCKSKGSHTQNHNLNRFPAKRTTNLPTPPPIKSQLNPQLLKPIPKTRKPQTNPKTKQPNTVTHLKPQKNAKTPKPPSQKKTKPTQKNTKTPSPPPKKSTTSSSNGSSPTVEAFDEEPHTTFRSSWDRSSLGRRVLGEALLGKGGREGTGAMLDWRVCCFVLFWWCFLVLVCFGWRVGCYGMIRWFVGWRFFCCCWLFFSCQTYLVIFSSFFVLTYGFLSYLVVEGSVVEGSVVEGSVVEGLVIFFKQLISMIAHVFVLKYGVFVCFCCFWVVPKFTRK